MTVYLDNAASTQPSPEVIEAMGTAMREHFANSSSLHGLGAAAARVLAAAREEVAALVHAAPGEIVFTGSGTEANALGIVGAARASRLRHLVVSTIEHAAVFNSARMLGDEGWQVETVSPEADGCVTVDAVLATGRPETSVVAIMLVNNEIGTLQPVADIGRALRALGRKIHFHVDAVQFAGLEALDVRTKGADSVAISAHKLHGPKGIGALWLRKGKRLAPLYGGGGQERDLRSGTENLPAAVGFGVAAVQARKDTQAATRVRELRDRLESLIGDTLTLISPSGIENVITETSLPKMQTFIVGGIYTSNNNEYDANYIFCALQSAQKLLGYDTRIQGIDFRLNNPKEANSVKEKLSEFLDKNNFAVYTWYDFHRELYTVMQIERWTAYIILSLIIAVASFNILGSLSMSVIEKKRDIGILRSMGTE